jgi:prepilin-type N-terminal cleavage/methylation domain-containing protein
MLRLKTGFTIIEALIAIAIVAVLSTVIFFTSKEYFLQAKAGKMASDLLQYKTAWLAWKSEKIIDSLDDNVIPDTDYGCTDNEPRMSNTYLYPDYLQGTLINPVTKDEYRYDFDSDYCTGSEPSGGVNVMTATCTDAHAQEMAKVAVILDEKLDRGDGYNSGLIRWNAPEAGDPTWYFRIYYRIACN